MEITFSEHVPVTDASSVGEARRRALLAGQRLGFDETRSGELALLATEASRNTLVHGGGGDLILAGIRHQQEALARILALDKGPGIPNIGQAMADGYSTSGTMGGGLGAMKRIAGLFDIFTGQSGTIVLIEFGSVATPEPLQIAGIAVPYPGERACGDGWTTHQDPGRTVVLVVDGLGHGVDASEAAQEAIATFRQRVQYGPAEILGYLHDALRKTRGGVAAIAEIRPGEGILNYAGVGNISGVLLGDGPARNLLSHNGTLGIATSRIQEFRLGWTPGSILILHSDGLQSRWDLSAYAGLRLRHPAVIGGVLLRDFRRHRDDASIVVVKAAV